MNTSLKFQSLVRKLQFVLRLGIIILLLILQSELYAQSRTAAKKKNLVAFTSGGPHDVEPDIATGYVKRLNTAPYIIELQQTSLLIRTSEVEKLIHATNAPPYLHLYYGLVSAGDYHLKLIFTGAEKISGTTYSNTYHKNTEGEYRALQHVIPCNLNTCQLTADGTNPITVPQYPNNETVSTIRSKKGKSGPIAFRVSGVHNITPADAKTYVDFFNATSYYTALKNTSILFEAAEIDKLIHAPDAPEYLHLFFALSSSTDHNLKLIISGVKQASPGVYTNTYFNEGGQDYVLEHVIPCKSNTCDISPNEKLVPQYPNNDR